MVRKLTLSVVNILLCVAIGLVGFVTPPSAQAQSQTGTIIPFSAVGVTDIVLNGPYDSDSVVFSLPDNWQLLDGTALDLYIQVFVSGSQNSSTQTGQAAGVNSNHNGALQQELVGATLNIYFNDGLQQSISLVVSEDRIYYQVPIRVQDLHALTRDGRLEISFLLNAGIDCDSRTRQTTVMIASESDVNIIHSEKKNLLDLRNLPRPIYKRDAYLPEVAKLVISDKASADELRAAYLAMAAFGRMSSRQLNLEIVTFRQLTQAILSESHLIFVGKPSSISLLSQLQTPVPVTAGKFVSPVLQTDDGIVQLLDSPWNSSKVILMVSGNTDAGVIKAAQALTTGTIQTSSNPAVSFVAQVASLDSQPDQGDNADIVSNLDYTLADLGYSVWQAGVGASGIGLQWFGYEFSIPVGQVVEEKSYFDFVFSYSSLVDTTRSEISVYINGTLTGSVGLETGKTSYVKKRIELPPTLIRPGRNRMNFAVDLIPLDICSTINLNGLWFTIFPESAMHFQLTQGSFADLKQAQSLELRSYPTLFLNTPSMSDLTIVLPQNNPSSWLAFGEMIYDLGSRATGDVISFDVGFRGMLSDAERANNLILFGIPTDLQLPDDLNAALPAPFEVDSNIAVLNNQTVVYRIEPTKSLGYLELFDSPWNQAKIILAVFGTDGDGVSNSTQILMDSKIRNELKGDFATIDGVKFTIVDTRSGLGLGSFPVTVGTEVVEKVFVTPETAINTANVPSHEGTRQMIKVTLFVALATMLLMIIIAVITKRKKLKKSEQ